MVIPKSVHVDALDVSTLRGPLLDDYYGSALQRRDVMAVAEEIKRRHLAKLPSQTGNLKSTARVTAHRSKEHRDRRYEAEYSIGGPRADYIVPLEDEHHYLDSVLREMGFYTGDIVNGPTGRIPASDKRPASLVSRASRERGSDAGLNVPGGANRRSGRGATSERGRQAVAEAARARDEREAGLSASTAEGYNRIARVLEPLERPGRRPGSAAMERDVAEVRRVMAELEAEQGPDAPGLGLGRSALTSYEQLRQARAERDAFLKARPYFRD